MQDSGKPQAQQLLTPDPDAARHLQEQNRERMQILEGDQVTPGGSGQGAVLDRLIDSKSDQVEQNILAKLKNDKASPDGFEEIKTNDII